MKKRLLKTLLIGSLLALVGCDSSTDDTNAVSNKELPTNIRMDRNKPYTVEKGDEIEKLPSNPNLKIESDLNSGKTIVTLLSGEAAIIKK